HQVSPNTINQYLVEQLAVKVSYLQVGSRCDHVIFTSSEQRSFGLSEQVSKAQCEGLSAVLVKAETPGASININQRSGKTCHGFLAGARPSLTAIFTRSARESAFIFCITLPRW